MGCSSEAAKKRTQRSNQGDRRNYSNNNKDIKEYSNRHINNNNRINSNNNNNSTLSNHQTSIDSNNSLLLSSEVICQSATDSDSDKSTISKDSSNNFQRTKTEAEREIDEKERDKTTVQAIEKTGKEEQQPTRRREKKGEDEQEEKDTAEAEETAEQIDKSARYSNNNNCNRSRSSNSIRTSVGAEALEVKAVEVGEVLPEAAEELQGADELCNFYGACATYCRQVAIDINNNNNTYTNNNNNKEISEKQDRDKARGNSCENFSNGRNYNCCNRQQCAQEAGEEEADQITHKERVALPPQAERDDDKHEQQQGAQPPQRRQEDKEGNVWRDDDGRFVGVQPTKEMDTWSSASAAATNDDISEPATWKVECDAAATVTHIGRYSKRLPGDLQQLRRALTQDLNGLSDDMSIQMAEELNGRAAREKQFCGVLEESAVGMCPEGRRQHGRMPHQQQQPQAPSECWRSNVQPLQMAYKRGRENVAKNFEQIQQQQEQQQRFNDLLLVELEPQQPLREEPQGSAKLYCHQKQKHQQHNNHQMQQQKQQQQMQLQQQKQLQQQQQQQKQHKQFKTSQQQQQHHSAQKQQEEQKEQQQKTPNAQLRSKELQILQLQHKQKQKQKLQQQKQQKQQQQQKQHKKQQQKRHLLRRGIQTMAAAAYGAFSYIGHNYYQLLGNTISFYAASSIILALCYLTTTTAATHSPDKAPFDKHPIRGIDWSKFDESSSDKEILDLLLEKKRYDKRLLPPVNDEDFCCGLSSPDMAKVSNSRRPHNRGTLTVNVNVLLLSLASPDESSLKYEVEFLLNQQWNDPRLQYGNKSHYDFLNALHHHDSIWTPDTYFIMHGDFKDPIIPMHFALRIYRNGTITYAMRRHLILSCQGSLHIFPFDDPKCSFSMESISYEEAQIKYVWKNDEDTLRKSPSLTTLNAYLIKNQTTPCDQNSWRGNYSCLRVDLIFTRDRAFYFTTVFIPGIILVTSSFITFWLEWNAVPARSMIGNYSCLEVELTFTRDRAYYFTTVFIPGIILVTSSFITFWLEWNAVPARVMIGVTTMLNFFTTSNGFRSTLPVVSNLTAMNVWDGVCMCFIYASLLEFVCVNYMGRKRPQHNAVYRPGENPVTQRLPAVLSRIGVILASPLGIIEREFNAAMSSEKGASSGTTTVPHTPTAHVMHHHHTYHTGMASPPMQQQMQQQQQASGSISTVDGARIRWEEQHGGIIGVTVQNLRARSIRRRTRSPGSITSSTGSAAYAVDTMEAGGRMAARISATMSTVTEPVYQEPEFRQSAVTAAQRDTTVTVEMEPPPPPPPLSEPEQRHRSISTNTPPLVMSGGGEKRTSTAEATTPTHDEEAAALDMPTDEHKQQQRATLKEAAQLEEANPQTVADASGHLPVKPPRRKRSRSNSPTALYEPIAEGVSAAATANGHSARAAETGEKRQNVRAPNEIVACTTCGGSSSPCTHSANNGCATETCFVQVRKKEPPHPIRIAKTIDVIARITFPTAYAIFLIFFFVHYKGFS